MFKRTDIGRKAPLQFTFFVIIIGRRISVGARRRALGDATVHRDALKQEIKATMGNISKWRGAVDLQDYNKASPLPVLPNAIRGPPGFLHSSEEARSR